MTAETLHASLHPHSSGSGLITALQSCGLVGGRGDAGEWSLQSVAATRPPIGAPQAHRAGSQ